MCRRPTCSANNKAMTSLFRSLQLLAVVVQSLNRVRLFATQWTVAHQAALCVGFFRQEYRSGLPFPSPGDLPDPGIELVSPALADRFFNTAPPAKPCIAWLRCCGQAQSRGVENRQYKGYKKQGFLNTWHLSPYRDSHNLSFFSFSVLKIIYKFMLSPNSRSNGLTLPISF